MKRCIRILHDRCAVVFCLAVGGLMVPSAATAQVSGGTYGNHTTEKENPPAISEPIVFKNVLPGSAAIETIVPVGPGLGDFLVGSDAADSVVTNPNQTVEPVEFDGGDGPDYITPIGPGPGSILVMKPNGESPVGFDGGDGPDYITPIGPGPGSILVMKPNGESPVGFDGGDGPDYITPIGPGPGSVLVMKPNGGSSVGFDGGDGPDYIIPISPGPSTALVGSDAADSFVLKGAPSGIVPVGLGPGDVLVMKPNGGSPVGFDGGDGPDYVIPISPGPSTALVGSDAADSFVLKGAPSGVVPVGPGPGSVLVMKPNGGSPVGFDGGDGPDYIMPISPEPSNALVGSDAADSIVLKGAPSGVVPVGPGPTSVLVMKPNGGSSVGFDGGDGPDYVTPIGPGPSDALVGSDAADSLTDDAATSESIELDDVVADVNQLMIFIQEALAVGVFSEVPELQESEMISHDEDGKSLKATENEGTGLPSLEERWIEWILMGNSVDTADLLPLTTELDLLFWEVEVGLLSPDQFDAELESLIEVSLMLRGILPESITAVIF